MALCDCVHVALVHCLLGFVKAAEILLLIRRLTLPALEAESQERAEVGCHTRACGREDRVTDAEVRDGSI